MSIEKVLELKQERANITNQIRTIMDEFENKEMDGTKKDEFQKLENRFDSLNDQILMQEKQIERERAIGEIQDNSKPDNSEKNDLMNAFSEHLKIGDSRTLEAYNALQLDNPTQAGYLVAPEKFVSELIKEIDNNLFVRQLAKVLPALKGAKSLGYPKRTARMNSAAWGTELQSPSADSTLAVGKREFVPRPATAEILVSKTLIRNTNMADQLIRSEIAYDFGELMENGYMTGSGAGQPLGLFTASDDGISTSRDVSTGNNETSMTFDGLKEAKYSIKSQYQNNLNWIFHRDGVKQIAKIKDGEGQYIWQQSVAMGEPDRLLKYPVRMSEYAPNTFTTGEYVGLLGDLKYYWIVDSMMMELQVLMELYARTNQVDYIARIETDGMPVLEEAFARVTLG